MARRSIDRLSKAVVSVCASRSDRQERELPEGVGLLDRKARGSEGTTSIANDEG